MVEGNHYFPVGSLNMEYLTASDHTMICSWKGAANYCHLNVDDAPKNNAAWFYANPKDAAANIKDRVAFGKGISVV